MSGYYPPSSFYYKVTFDFFMLKIEENASFQSVSGLSIEYDMEEFKEGGENRFVHKLPVRTKYADLVLKRGMLKNSNVISWCLAAFQVQKFIPIDISIILMNEEGQPLRTWNIAHAIPKKWTVSDFNAQENSIVIETLELTYRYFSINNGEFPQFLTGASQKIYAY